MQDVEPIAIAQISRRFHAAVAAETYAIGFKLIDLEATLAAIETCDIIAVALARDLEIIDPMIELNADRKRKCRGERAAFAPRRGMTIGHIKQQRRERHFRGCVLARRQQIVAMLGEKSRRRFAGSERRMPQAGGEERLIGGYAERGGLLEAGNELAPRLVAG